MSVNRKCVPNRLFLANSTFIRIFRHLLNFKTFMWHLGLLFKGLFENFEKLSERYFLKSIISDASEQKLEMLGQ